MVVAHMAWRIRIGLRGVVWSEWPAILTWWRLCYRDETSVRMGYFGNVRGISRTCLAALHGL